jgi:hypothetical protein
MTRKQMEKLISQIFKNIQKTREAGQKEYARKQNNAFANFERIGDYLNLSRDKVLLVYLLKHIDGIIAHVEGHSSQREEVTGRVTDAIVYLCLLWGMIEDDKKKSRNQRYLEQIEREEK